MGSERRPGDQGRVFQLAVAGSIVLCPGVVGCWQGVLTSLHADVLAVSHQRVLIRRMSGRIRRAIMSAIGRGR